MTPLQGDHPPSLALLLDFDGTAAKHDIGIRVLEKFARDDSWKIIDNDYVGGRVGSRMAYRVVEGLLEGSLEDWTRYVLNEFHLDSGLEELVRLAERQGWLLEILSDGLSYYIHALLNRAGLEVAVRTNELVGGDDGEARARVVTPHVNPRCGRCGTCKTERVENLRAAGWTVVYVGDGYSDLCAAPRAHRLFAKDVLARHCAERGIPFELFETLEDVVRALSTLETTA